ncbi:MAG: hypothetical protein M9897_00500 [Brumimicrobium sp.]|nr:hypothetical protein [Brumimicrobium sp.]
MRILLILTFLLFSSCLYSQEEHLALQNERIYQLGGYYGNGYTPWIKEANPMYYLGIRAHLPYKKHRFRRSEVYLQFSGIFSSNKSSINENPSSYNNVRQTIRKDQSVFADIGTKIQFKAVNYYRFRFYVSPFIGAGWVLYTGASITKHIYNDPHSSESF